MNREDLYNNILMNTDNDKYLNPKPIDNVTDAGKGFAQPIDNRTDAGKGFAQPIDNRTDYGRGIFYKGWDGKEFGSMEEVIQYNDMFYKSMMINSEEKRIRR